MTYDPERIINIGELEKRGKTVRFGIKEKDRSRHVYVIGQTGTGKSTLLEMMAMQDLKNGTGLIFLDPHGQSVNNILQYITRDRLDNVIYFAPHLQEKPIGLNIMEDIGYDKRHLVVSSLMASFEKIWGAATWSDRMAYILSNTLLALIEYPGTTLLDVGRMYTSKSFRGKVVANLKDPQVKKYWTEEFEGYTDRYAQEATPSIQNKIGQFTSNPLMRNIIGQKESAFDFRKIMDDGKMLLVNLSKGQIGENNARMLGVLFTTKIYLAALSRSDMTKTELEAAKPCNFFVDEFQSFANSSFSDILSEARKYKLNLILAHQYLGQLYTDDTGGGNAIRDAVFGNVGTFISFRVGPVDAEIIAKQFAPNIAEEDLVALPRYHVYLTLNIDGAGSPPFSARTFYEPASGEESIEDEVIKRTMDTYGVDREIVEDVVRKNLEEDDRANQMAKKAAGSGGKKKQQQGGGNRGSGRQQQGDATQEKTHMPLKGLVEQVRQAPLKATTKAETENTFKEVQEKEVKAISNKQKKENIRQEQNDVTATDKKSLWGKLFSKNGSIEQKNAESTKQQQPQKVVESRVENVAKLEQKRQEEPIAVVKKVTQQQTENPQKQQVDTNKQDIRKHKMSRMQENTRQTANDREQKRGKSAHDRGKQQRRDHKQEQRNNNREITRPTKKDSRQQQNSNERSFQNNSSKKPVVQKRKHTHPSQNNKQQQKEEKVQQSRTQQGNSSVKVGQPKTVSANTNTITRNITVRSQNEQNDKNNNRDTVASMNKQQQESTRHKEKNGQMHTQNESQHDKKHTGGEESGLGNLVHITRASGLQKSLKVEQKKEKKTPPINYEEGWVSIGDISEVKQDT